MQRTIIIIILAAVAMLAAQNAPAQERSLQYTPTYEGYIKCQNGKNLYTRAIYGGPSLWRLETSDRPIFGAYHKNDDRNIHFAVVTKDHTVRLDSAAECSSLWRGGERIYQLSDPRWGKGVITMTVVASPEGEGAIWQVMSQEMPKGSVLKAYTCATVERKLSRGGDMGADPANAFAPHPAKLELKECEVPLNTKSYIVNVTKSLLNKEGARYIEYTDRDITSADQAGIQARYTKARQTLDARNAQIKISTPDQHINTLATTLLEAADAIWDGETYLHGAIGWRMKLNGWRGAYTGDFLGQHGRARSHFDAYATSQVDAVAPTIPHPAQDPEKGLARAEKRWGTPMYSNGYICRNPGRKDQMHHYDMNLVYIDQLLWHLKWTGDLDYARKMWPTIAASLAWEKRNYDPNDDGLYDAYCCIWASDALYYNSGAVTHSTAYNYRANTIAAEIAEKIGQDPTPYRREAEKILQGINKVLWLEDRGVWAEYRDLLGRQLVHDHPGLWTVYHAIESGAASKYQAHRATGYIERNIPHILVSAEGLTESGLYTLSTTDWMPYTWSVNNVAFAEVYHTALAYWQAGRSEAACRLLRAAMMDGMFIGDSPGNIGQISHYDAARGETYRDFADPVGVLARAVVQGLFGFTPDALNHRVSIRPGWPIAWQHASISHPDFGIDFRREPAADVYELSVNLPGIDTIDFKVNALRTEIKQVTVDGHPAQWRLDPESYGSPSIDIRVATQGKTRIEIAWDGAMITQAKNLQPLGGAPYREMTQGSMRWQGEALTPAMYDPVPPLEATGLQLLLADQEAYRAVHMETAYNANITDIFTNRYESPRSPYTTLQIPVHGIGDWCHPETTANIDDSALRSAQGVLVTSLGLPFATPTTGWNVAYVSMFDTYPDEVTVPLKGSARAINLLMTGSTNHMQCYVPNAEVQVVYADGRKERLELVPPYNWAPIEQDYYLDGKAFDVATPRPYRLSLKDGRVSTNLAHELGSDTSINPMIDGGAAILLSIPLKADKELKELRLKAIANDVVTGLIGATYVR